MPTFDIDLTTADVIPEADYVLTVKSVECKPSKAGDNTLVNWTLVVNSPEEFAGRVIFHNCNFKMPNRIKQMMDATKSPYTKDGFDPDATVGKQINARIGQLDDAEYGLKNIVVKAWAI
jgi:hypothetical protein